MEPPRAVVGGGGIGFSALSDSADLHMALANISNVSFRGLLTLRVQTNLLETLSLNRVVRSVSTFVCQPGRSALGILSGSSRCFCLFVFFVSLVF